MRTILFRGKSKVNVNYLGEDEPLVKKGEWVYGSLIFDDVDNHHIHTLTRRGYEFVNVEVESIGQFTGLFDAARRGIYEGDIIKIEDEGVSLKPKVVDFNNGMFGTGDFSLAYYGEDVIKVIGNIHDNPKLLEEIK